MTLIKILIGLSALTALVFLIKPRAFFTIVVKNGKAVVKNGKPPEAFITECEHLTNECNLSYAVIKGFLNKGRISLKFSKNIPSQIHQKFRNAYSFCS